MLAALVPVASGAPSHAEACPVAQGARVERRVGAMGTTLALEVRHRSRPEALAASEAAVRAVEDVEARLSTWREGSELSRLNRAPAGEPFALSEELAHELALARDLWRATDGAFDPGVGALLRLRGVREGGGRVPAEAELRAALAVGGLSALELDGRVAVRRDPGLVLDAGGFGKGLGLDAALRALRDAGAAGACLDFGGQVAVLDVPEGEPGWHVVVADPRRRGREVLELELRSGSLATTGTSERGEHVLDPRSGLPARDFGSVSVLAPSAFEADALSTGYFVLGPERALAHALARDGVDALVLEPRGEALAARATAPLEHELRVLAADVELEPFPLLDRGATEEDE